MRCTIDRLGLSRIITVALLFTLVLFYLFVSLAGAATTHSVDQPPGDVISGLNLVDVVIGLVVPLVGYLLNHFAPWASEQAKGLTQLALAAGAGAVHQAIGAGNFGLNQQTLVAVLTVMASAVAAHVAYSAGGINVALGAGVNSDGTPSTTRRLVG